MRKSLITSMFLILVVLIAACGQKSDTTSGDAEIKVVYTAFAEASAAAEQSGKHMVLDFYTDW